MLGLQVTEPFEWDNFFLEQVSRIQFGTIKYTAISNMNEMRLRELFRRSPNSLFCLRSHTISEHHDQLHADPEGQGIEHADFWNHQIKNNVPSEIPRNQFFCLGNNEPFVDDPEHAKRADRYGVAFAERMMQYGYRPGTHNISTGNPNPDYWKQYFRASYEATKAAKGFEVLHEYWGNTGPDAVYPFHVGRFQNFPWTDVPVFIGECGLEQKVLTKGPHEGWKIHLPDPRKYMDQLIRYKAIAQSISNRIAGLSIFTLCNNSPWNSLDYRELLPLFPKNSEFDDMMWVYGGDAEEGPDRGILVAADNNQVIQFNPDAALQKQVYADGFQINSGEFTYVSDGDLYVAQRAEHLRTGEVRCYWVKYGDWGNVGYYTR